MILTKLPNGNLRMEPGPKDQQYLLTVARRRRLGASKTESWFLKHNLWRYKEIKPEDVGALTDAPMMQDREGNVWAFMDYQVTSFLEELAAGRPVVWTHGGKPEGKA